MVVHQAPDSSCLQHQLGGAATATCMEVLDKKLPSILPQGSKLALLWNKQHLHQPGKLCQGSKTSLCDIVYEQPSGCSAPLAAVQEVTFMSTCVFGVTLVHLVLCSVLANVITPLSENFPLLLCQNFTKCFVS